MKKFSDGSKVLLSRPQIQSRVTQLAKELDRYYRGKHVVVIAILNGSVIFLADLLKKMKTPLSFDCVSASSYGRRTRSSGRVLFHPHLKIEVRDAHVLLVDDILDTGRTLARIVRFFKSLHPASVETCVLLRKRVRRAARVSARFVGFDIPNHFVFGYGLDIAERFRNLPYIAFKPE